MVRLHYPSQLTEEEEKLQRKYAKLKKLRKAVQALKTKKAEEPPPSKQTADKRTASEAALDAKEEAKKLIKTGAIKLHSSQKEKSFKRAKVRSNKDEKSTPQLGFQPFTASSSSEDRPGSSQAPRVDNLYKSFVKESRDEDVPKRGHTVYVHGNGLTEDMMKSVFSKIGTIVNINVEPVKHCAFVTFDSTESADNAILQMNGVIHSDIRLKVSLARRQPNFDQPFQDSSPSSSSWSSIAASKSQKGQGEQGKRELVTYEDNPFDEA